MKSAGRKARTRAAGASRSGKANKAPTKRRDSGTVTTVLALPAWQNASAALVVRHFDGAHAEHLAEVVASYSSEHSRCLHAPGGPWDLTDPAVDLDERRVRITLHGAACAFSLAEGAAECTCVPATIVLDGQRA